MNNTIEALRSIGITIADPAVVTPLPGPQVTAAEVAAAIRASTAPNPYQDPAVQALLVEYQARQYVPALAQAYAETQVAANDAALLTNLTAINTQVRDKFAAQATILGSAAQTLPNVKDLRGFDYTTATAAQAGAASDATKALGEVERILTAWESLHNLSSPHVASTNARRFFALNWSPTQWKNAVQLGRTSVWDGATSGVTLSLAATPAAASTRYTAALNG